MKLIEKEAKEGYMLYDSSTRIVLGKIAAFAKEENINNIIEITEEEAESIIQAQELEEERLRQLDNSDSNVESK